MRAGKCMSRDAGISVYVEDGVFFRSRTAGGPYSECCLLNTIWKRSCKQTTRIFPWDRSILQRSTEH